MRPQYRRFGFVDFDAMGTLASSEGDDEFVCRRANGDNVIVSRAAIIAGAGSVPDPLLLGNGSAAAPTYSFAADPDTGVFRLGTNQLGFAVNGIAQFIINPTELSAVISGGPLLKNSASSATVPNIVPSSSDVDTGIGTSGANILSLIAGGREIASFRGPSANARQLTVPVQDNAGAPALAFGDRDTGFTETVDDNLHVSIAGVYRWRWNSTDFRSFASGGPVFKTITASRTNPNIVSNTNDVNTGIGFADDEFIIIAGAVEGISVAEVSGSITAAVKMGGGVNKANIIGVANVNVTAVGNVGVGVDDLITFSLAANSLSVDGKGIRITVWGTFASNGNTKQVNLDFGATTIRQIGPAAINGLDWRIDGIVIRTGAATQKAIATEIVDTTAPDSTLTTPAETLSSAVIIKCTGEGVADNDIVQEGMLIEHLS